MKVREGETVNNTKERKKLTKMGGVGKKKGNENVCKRESKNCDFCLINKDRGKTKNG